MYFKFPLRPHQKYNITHTVYKTWLFIAYSGERWLYYHTFLFLFKRFGECNFEFGSERVKPSQPSTPSYLFSSFLEYPPSSSSLPYPPHLLTVLTVGCWLLTVDCWLRWVTFDLTGSHLRVSRQHGPGVFGHFGAERGQRPYGLPHPHAGQAGQGVSTPLQFTVCSLYIDSISRRSLGSGLRSGKDRGLIFPSQWPVIELMLLLRKSKTMRCYHRCSRPFVLARQPFWIQWRCSLWDGTSLFSFYLNVFILLKIVIQRCS